MEAPKPYREKRPWGEFVQFTKNTPSTVKIITVKAGESLSLQKHGNRAEFWRVISGVGSIEIGDDSFSAKQNDEYFVPRGTTHRMSAGTAPLIVLEIAFGDFDESDIERLEDRYGRVS